MGGLQGCTACSRASIVGQRHYEVRVKVSAEELAKRKGYYLSPGMPAEVIIVTGERSMLAYLAEPVMRSLRQAFVYD